MTDKNIILKSYLDKAYINGVLCDYHYQYYYKINMIAMLPLILGSSILTVLNTSTIDNDIMKIINVSINGANTLIMALITQYKLNDRITQYKTYYSKYQKLSHKIESILNNTQEITDKICDDIIIEYDALQDDNNFTYLSSYKKQVIKIYGGKKQLPNSLALEADIVSIQV